MGLLQAWTLKGFRVRLALDEREQVFVHVLLFGGAEAVRTALAEVELGVLGYWAVTDQS